LSGGPERTLAVIILRGEKAGLVIDAALDNVLWQPG
jgi:hypothetical protein